MANNEMCVVELESRLILLQALLKTITRYEVFQLYTLCAPIDYNGVDEMPSVCMKKNTHSTQGQLFSIDKSFVSIWQRDSTEQN